MTAPSRRSRTTSRRRTEWSSPLRLAILSDIHGNLAALEAVLADLAPRGVDGIVNLGDLVTGPLWPAETLDLLETCRMTTVRGNHDRWIAERNPASMTPSMRFTLGALKPPQIAALHALPTTLMIGAEVLALHGTPTDDSSYLLEDARDGRLQLASPHLLRDRLGGCSAELVLCGHSHHQHLATAAGDVLILNPGSVGCPRYADDAAPSLAEAGSRHARYAVATRRGGRWGVELLALAYDWDRVAARARINGRPDWADAFTTQAATPP